MKNQKLRNKLCRINTSQQKKLNQQSISFCITIKNRSVFKHNSQIYKLFPRCLEQLLKVMNKNDEIIITDWGSTDYPILRHHNNQKIKIHHIDKSKFSRGYGLNQCSKYSKKNILFFMDSDLLLPKEFINSIRCMPDNKSYFPIVKREIPGRKKKLAKMAYGTCVIHHSNFKKSPKWPEFYKWGNEDIIFYESLKKDLKIKLIREKSDIIHMWHPPSNFSAEWINDFIC